MVTQISCCCAEADIDADIMGELSAVLCRLQLDGARAFSLLPPLPLTLIQALLSVPGWMPDTQICLILTRQSGPPNFEITSQMPTEVDQIYDPKYSFRLFQDMDEARSCSKNTSLYSALGVISLLGKRGLEKWEQRFLFTPLMLSPFRYTSFSWTLL